MADGGMMEDGGRIKLKPINYNSYDNRSLEYLLGEIAHTERSARQFSNSGDMESAKDRQEHAKKLWNIYYEKKG